jgi:hypothetical protein
MNHLFRVHPHFFTLHHPLFVLGHFGGHSSGLGVVIIAGIVVLVIVLCARKDGK